MTIVTSFSGLCLLLVLGKFARIKIKLLQRLYLPSSVIGGLLGLIIVQLAGDALPSMWTAGWLQLPGFLINIVFAALFLGVSIPPLSIIWRISGPQLAYGQIVAWGQYVIGLGLVLILLGPLFDVPDLFGVIIPIGFEGGHGTAAGLRETFLQLDWSAGSDFALASATVGIISAIITGITLINWAARKEYIAHIKRNKFVTAEEMAGLYPVDKRPIAGVQTTLADSIDSLAMHLAIIGIAILIGYGLKVSLMGIETLFSSLSDLGLFSGFPLFPLCMIGGLLVQLSLMHFVKTSPVDHSLMQRLAGTALDFLVVAAVSTIQLNVIARNLIPFIILVTGGIIWNIFCVVWLARRVLPNFWFERSIAEMGQSMGVTATGLLLLRVVDPEQKTDASSAFGYKQLLHEPFMGGGLWTSSAVILVARKGAALILLFCIAVILLWLILWWIFLKQKT